MKKKTGKIVSSLEYVTNMIHRYRRGKASIKDREMLEKWIPDSNLLNSSTLDDSFIDTNTEKVWVRIAAEIYKEKRSKIVIQQLSKYVAAVVVLVLITGILWHFISPAVNNHYSDTSSLAQTSRIYYQTTQESPVTSISLPDGSNIRLNKETKIYIDQSQFNHLAREVWIEEGEVFFEVAKDVEKPFIVYHGELQTVVRGTSFNIKAYKSLHENVVSVRSGKVEVGTNSKKLLGVLTQDKQLNYCMDNKSADISDTKWNDACGWMDGRLVLNKANIDELKLRIKQHYKKEVLIEGDALNTMLLTSSFEKGTTLEQVMEIISAMYGINYNITHGQVILYD